MLQAHGFDYHFRDDPRRRLVTTEHDLWEMVRVLLQQRMVAFDTETTGLRWFKHARMCGFSFTARLGPDWLQSWYVPFRHATGETQLHPSLALRALSFVLGAPQIIKVSHNQMFDWHMVRADGLDIVGPRRDTMIEAHLYDENAPLALKTRANIDLRRPEAVVYEKLVEREVMQCVQNYKGMGKKEYLDRYGYSHIRTNVCGVYACLDTEFTFELAEFYDREGVTANYALTYKRELDLAPVLIRMEEEGLDCDVNYLAVLRHRTEQVQAYSEPLIFGSLGYKFNPNSAEEVRHVLQHRMGIKLWRTTKTGDLSVEAEVLEENIDEHPAIQHILNWRQANKIRTTYTTSLLNAIGDDGKLHGQFQSVGTRTGRLSSKNPNLHNFGSDSDARAVAWTGKKIKQGGQDPLSVKRAFTVPEGTSRILLDYSQIELRVLAGMSKDPTMHDVYMNKGDIHLRTQSEVFNSSDPNDLAARRNAKSINFGLSYCLSAKGFARQAKIELQKAEYLLDTFFHRYPRIMPFRHEFWDFCRANGCRFVNPFGRPRHIPNLMSRDGFERGRAERQAIGSLIQGTAAELTKISLIRLQAWIDQEGLPFKLNTTIHDEIQFNSPSMMEKFAASNAKKIMEDFNQLHPIIPETDAEVFRTNWSEKKGLKLDDA